MTLRVFPPNTLEFQGRRYTCALGKGGVTGNKREGDGATPLGVFPLRRVFFRADRLTKPETSLPAVAIGLNDGWCDDPTHPYYNRLVALPMEARHEILWRKDQSYDLLIELGYNDDPVQKGRGSAIFIHVTKPDYEPTEGCVALITKDLLQILKACGPQTQIRIDPSET